MVWRKTDRREFLKHTIGGNFRALGSRILCFRNNSGNLNIS